MKIDYHAPLNYDVVRIKPHGDNLYQSQNLPNGLSFHGVSLSTLIALAFGLRNEQVVGGPEWTRSMQFDLDARVDEEKIENYKKLSSQSKNAMLRPILLERFHVSLETDSRRFGVYDLIVARDGPKLKSHSSADDAPEKAYTLISFGKWNMPATPIPFLAVQLSATINDIVCDQTKLSGIYDIKLTFSSAGLTPMAQGSIEASAEPDLFTAVKEQLGLQLVPAKELIPVVVIRNAAQPSDD